MVYETHWFVSLIELYCTSYPVTRLPPSSNGASHDASMLSWPGSTTRSLGAPGAVTGVVSGALSEAAPLTAASPLPATARIRKSYSVPPVRPVTA